MKYVVFPDQTIGGEKVTEKISKALFNLMKPESERSVEDVTTKLFNWITHPSTGELALQWDEDFVMNLHNNRNTADFIQLYVNLNKGTDNRELKEIKKLLDENGQVTAGQLISKDFVLKTDTEMVTDGWFPELNN